MNAGERREPILCSIHVSEMGSYVAHVHTVHYDTDGPGMRQGSSLATGHSSSMS